MRNDTEMQGVPTLRVAQSGREQVYWRIWIRKRIFLLRKSRNKEVAERSFWKSDAEFYRIRHTRIRHEADGEDKPKMVSKEEEKRMKQDSAGQFSQCNRCGARIMWVKTKAGKNMPVDPQFVDFKKIKGGKERLVLPNGEVVAGERCKAKEADGYGYISHFATCPGTADPDVKEEAASLTKDDHTRYRNYNPERWKKSRRWQHGCRRNCKGEYAEG